jgi:hypothetical protein
MNFENECGAPNALRVLANQLTSDGARRDDGNFRDITFQPENVSNKIMTFEQVLDNDNG